MSTLRRIPRRALHCSLIAMLILPWGAIGQDGYLVLYHHPSFVKPEVRRMRTLRRIGALYTGFSSAGKLEQFEARFVPGIVDLALLTPENLHYSEHLQNAIDQGNIADRLVKSFPELAPFVAARFALLRKEIARFESGERKIDGRWLTAAEYAARNAPHGDSLRRGTLVLTDGTSYRDVEIVAANEQMLRIIHSDGATSVPMRFVPEDFKKEYLSPTPAQPNK